MNISKKMKFCLVALLLIVFAGNASEEKMQKFNMVQGYCIKQSRKRLLINTIIDKLALSPDGKSIVFCENNTDYTLKVWDTQAGVFKYNLVGHERYITSLEFSSDGKWIVSTSTGNKNNLIVWNALDGTLKYNLTGHPGTVNSAKFSPNGTLIVSCSYGDENNLIVWDVSSGTQKYNLIGHSYLPNSPSVDFAEFSPDGSLIVSSSSGGQNNLIVWNALSGELKYSLVGSPKDVLSVTFSPDGKKIVSSYSMRDENNLFVWNALNGRLEYKPLGGKGDFSSSSYSSNGKWILAGEMFDHAVWNALNGKFKYSLMGSLVMFSPDGTHIITNSYTLKGDKDNIIILNALDGKKKYSLKGHYTGIYLIKFSLNGNVMISASHADISGNRHVFLWDIRPLKWNANDFSDNQVSFLYELYMQKKENKEIIKQAFNILDLNKSWFSLDGLKNSAFGKKVYELYKFLSFK